MLSIIIQGIHGAFHEEAANKYFHPMAPRVIPAHTFEELAQKLLDSDANTKAIIAIENSIAGSLLQNYRILREHQFTIIGEVYLRIEHQLMALPGTSIQDLMEVHSHPMAINQCLHFFSDHPSIQLIESKDTALSAKIIADNQLKNIGAIASRTAAQIFGLELLAEGIETSPHNYTRFFIIQKEKKHQINRDQVNKASIYIRVKDQPGHLFAALQHIASEKINLSKLQSYPVLEKVGEYYFHMDLEFDHIDHFYRAYENLKKETISLELLGMYQKNKDL